jgi:hypothetical protein
MENEVGGGEIWKEFLLRSGQANSSLTSGAKRRYFWVILSPP